MLLARTALVLTVVCLFCNEAASIISSVQDLAFDVNDRIVSNYLLYSDGCAKYSIPNFSERASELMGQSLAAQFFGDVHDECALVCLEKGVHHDSVLDPLPMHVNKHVVSDPSPWVHSNCQKVESGLLSYNANEAYIYWINGEGERVQIGILKRGEKNTSWHTTYLGHRFELVDVVTGELLLAFTVTHNAITPIGSPESMLMKREVSRQVQSTFYQEWNRAHTVKRTFTEFGFTKGRLPSDLWASISAYYYNNRNNKVLEEWKSKGLYVNWWERDVYFIPMPWQLKTYWQSRLKDLVQDWAGVELELTDIYGMRRYEDGARLLTHVDREQTHAASLIINVAQSKVRKPWTVEIYDFADRLHEIEMDEGDIVYYESARCLHGRMQPLEAEFYVNLFAHYRPVGDPQWYLKPNPPDAPPQRLDIGKCTASQDGIAGGGGGDNATPAVQCTGATLHEAKFLSPKLSTLHGPMDLYDFWKDTTPNGERSDTITRTTKANDEL